MMEGTTIPDVEHVTDRMHELEKVISYDFNDIRNLLKAMYVGRTDTPGSGVNHREYGNDPLATVGDALLKFILADRFYMEGGDRGGITVRRSELENNRCLYEVSRVHGIYRYAFNGDHFFDNAPPEGRLPNSGDHNPYVEAIVAAVYYDSDYGTCRRWVDGVLMGWISDVRDTLSG